MEETHQEVMIKLREDMKREEEKHISRAVAEVRSEEDEKQHEMIQEYKLKERERIQAAVDAERRIMESQHGSVTQLQQVRKFPQRECYCTKVWEFMSNILKTEGVFVCLDELKFKLDNCNCPCF